MPLSRIFAFAFLFLAQSLTAATITVGPPPASIQTAINSANNGDTIQLSAGSYVEQVQVVSKNLTIVGAGENTTIIQAPAAATPLTQFFTFGSNFWCVLMIDNQAAPTVQTVNISALTVDGGTQQDTTTLPAPSPGFYGSSNRFFAIGYHNASGTITNVHTTNTRQSTNFNELAGGGIVNASSSGTATFTVSNSLVDFYQRQGIDLRGATLTATITNTTVDRAYTLTPNTTTATPNGIQFSAAATGSVINSTISGNISTTAGTQATGIIPFGAGPNVLLSGNALNDNDIGIAAISNGDGLHITGNAVSFSSGAGVNAVEGIVAQDTAGLTTLDANTMTNIPGIAMDLIASSTNEPFTLSGNHFVGGQTGLSVTGNTTTGPVVTMNADTFTGTTGDYITETTAPNDIWPSTQTVYFDGLLSGHMTPAEFNQVLAKIVDKHNDPTLGLVLDFIPPSPPALTAINPASGPASGGNTVTITGTGFLSTNTTVNFGATAATGVVVVSDTQITASAPAGTGIVDVTVTTPFGTTTVVPADAYTYLRPGLAMVFAPTSIVAGATSTLTITLSNPNSTPATLTANLVDTFPANVFVATTPSAATNCSAGTLTAAPGSTSITFASGAGIPATGSCTVQVAVTSPVPGSYGNSLATGSLQTNLGSNAAPAAATLGVTALPPPTLTAISPSSGPAAGGTSVTITGAGFLAGGVTVAFGANPGTNVVVVSDTQITVSAPPGTGTVDVRVTTPSGRTSIVAADAFTYLAPTLSLAFSPASIVAGTTSTLTIALSNPNGTPATLTASLVDLLPAGLIVAAIANASTTCSAGVLTATPGASSVTLATNAGIPAAGACIVQFDVTSHIANSYTSTAAVGALQTSVGSNVAGASATLVVTAAVPPTPVPSPIDSTWMLALLAIVLLGAAGRGAAPTRQGRAGRRP